MTITDVAKEAGVSITTVSRALNGNYPIKTETRAKIDAAIKKLNYKPNVMARSMITRKSMTIGVITPGLTNLFFPTIIEEIESVMGEAGFKIAVCNSKGDAEVEQAVAEDFVARQLDGIIALDPSKTNLDSDFFYELSKEVPLLITNGKSESYKGNFICYDEEQGARNALETLVKFGHRKIAIIRGERSISFALREDLYHKVLKEKGIAYKKVICVEKGNSQAVVENTKDAVSELIKEKERPTAIFACNDLMALAALNTCTEAGLKVPEDISIIGFDNTLFSMVTNPEIATVDLKMAEIGQLAAKKMLALIENKELKVKEGIETCFILRNSCSEVSNKR